MHTINGFSYKKLFLLAIQKPIMAQIELTKNCNQSCFFCFRQCQPNSHFPDQSLSQWKKAIKKMASVGINELNFSGGEIFLFKKANLLFSYAKKQGIKKIVVNTNGLCDIKHLDLSAVDQLVFSIHGPRAIHDKITGVIGAFKQANLSIQHALNKKIAVGINTVVSEININFLKQTYALYKNHHIAFHAFNYVISQTNSVNDEKFNKQFKHYLSFLKKVSPKKLKLRHGLQNIVISDKKFFQSAIPLPHCAAGKYKIVLDYKGDVYPCRYFQTKKYFCGNIFKDDLASIWKNGRGFNFFRKMVLDNILPPACQNCLKKFKCRGGCLAWRQYAKSKKLYEQDIRCEIGDAYIGN